MKYELLVPNNIREVKLIGLLLNATEKHKVKCKCRSCEIANWYWATMHIWANKELVVGREND